MGLWCSAPEVKGGKPPSSLISVLVTGIQPTRLRGGESSFSLRTWAGWIPVTSTGMRRESP
ncbi:hypothetical protein EGT36_08960 [Agrobacterium sp. FDAARGOS_525]|nr:hypothetical protein EGT36_08960 [Agrobacterium sp. FDAARGOS_525]